MKISSSGIEEIKKDYIVSSQQWSILTLCKKLLICSRLKIINNVSFMRNLMMSRKNNSNYHLKNYSKKLPIIPSKTPYRKLMNQNFNLIFNLLIKRSHN